MASNIRGFAILKAPQFYEGVGDVAHHVCMYLCVCARPRCIRGVEAESTMTCAQMNRAFNQKHSGKLLAEAREARAPFVLTFVLMSPALLPFP